MAEQGRLQTYTRAGRSVSRSRGPDEKARRRPGAAVRQGQRPRHAGDRQSAVLPGQCRSGLRRGLPQHPAIRRPGAGRSKAAGAGRARARSGAGAYEKHRPRQDAAGAAPHRRRRRALHHRRHRHRPRSRHRRLQRVLSPADAGRAQPRRDPARFRAASARGVRARPEEGPASAGRGLHRRGPRAALHRGDHGLADAGERRRACRRRRLVRPRAAGGEGGVAGSAGAGRKRDRA